MKIKIEKHPKLVRALHTFWQAALGGFLTALATLIPTLGNQNMLEIDKVVIVSMFFSAICGGVSAGLSAIKSLIAGVPEEQ